MQGKYCLMFNTQYFDAQVFFMSASLMGLAEHVGKDFVPK